MYPLAAMNRHAAVDARAQLSRPHRACLARAPEALRGARAEDYIREGHYFGRVSRFSRLIYRLRSMAVSAFTSLASPAAALRPGRRRMKLRLRSIRIAPTRLRPHPPYWPGYRGTGA